MCGKFTQMASWEQVRDYAGFLSDPGAPHQATWATPMRFARVLALDGEGRRINAPMRWGFLDRRAKSPAERPRHIHARAETIDALPRFAAAFAGARGLLVVKTFNIGEQISPTKTVQHVVAPPDGRPLALAVIWERWTSRDEGELLTFAMATVPASAQIAPLADRMPAIIPPEDWARWLGEAPATTAELKAMLRPLEDRFDIAEQAKATRSTSPRRAEGRLV